MCSNSITCGIEAYPIPGLEMLSTWGSLAKGIDPLIAHQVLDNLLAYMIWLEDQPVVWEWC